MLRDSSDQTGSQILHSSWPGMASAMNFIELKLRPWALPVMTDYTRRIVSNSDRQDCGKGRIASESAREEAAIRNTRYIDTTAIDSIAGGHRLDQFTDKARIITILLITVACLFHLSPFAFT